MNLLQWTVKDAVTGRVLGCVLAESYAKAVHAGTVKFGIQFVEACAVDQTPMVCGPHNRFTGGMGFYSNRLV